MRQLDQRTRVLNKAVEPGPRLGIAIRRIDTGDDYTVDRRFDVPTLYVFDVARQSATALNRIATL